MYVVFGENNQISTSQETFFFKKGFIRFWVHVIAQSSLGDNGISKKNPLKSVTGKKSDPAVDEKHPARVHIKNSFIHFP